MSSTTGSSSGGGLPERPIAPDWLALREPADVRARDSAADTLLPPLVDRLAVPGSNDPALRVVDLGAGTGSNLRWLSPRLANPDQQHWMLVDHDPGLLARTPVHATPVRADVAHLSRVLPEIGGADLITSAALLDLLDLTQVTAIVEAVVEVAVPALFALNVTGEVQIDPADPRDARLAQAFDAHQRRGGRLGPDSGPVMARLFRERGWHVIEARTSWVLDAQAGDAELIDAWLAGRVEAAVEQDRDLGPEAADWLSRRHSSSGTQLRVLVGHVDVLALPN